VRRRERRVRHAQLRRGDLRRRGIWSTAATVTNNTASTTNHAVTATARWVRLSTTDDVARIYEFEVY